MVRLLLIFTLLITCLEGRSQETNRRRVYVGMDVFKNFLPLIDKEVFFNSSIIIEPIAQIELAKHLFLNVQVGYSKIGKEVVFKNFTQYRNEGGYLKAGILCAFKEDDGSKLGRVGFGMGVNLTFAHFDERGITQLTGPFFGNLNKDYSRKNINVVGLEIPFNIPVRIADRWKLNLQPRINGMYVLGGYDILKYPIYYTPGSGIYTQPETYSVQVPPTSLNGGFTIQLFYRLR